MLPTAIFLTLLSLTVLWLNVELWRSRPLGVVFHGGEERQRSSDRLDPLRAVALVGLAGLVVTTVHTWTDRVGDYSDDDVRQAVSQAAGRIDDLDPVADGGLDLGIVEQRLGEESDLDRLRVRSVASEDPLVQRFQVTNDEGDAPVCLVAEADPVSLDPAAAAEPDVGSAYRLTFADDLC